MRDGCHSASQPCACCFQGAASHADAKRVATTVATSPLVKTAIYGQDANWGRLLSAVGRSGASSVHPERVTVAYVPADPSLATETPRLDLVVHGIPQSVDEEHASKLVQ